MKLFEEAILHIRETAKIPSFSTYEERLHPYIKSIFEPLHISEEIQVPGNSLVYKLANSNSRYTVALAAHIDKINHYGKNHPDELPVDVTDSHIEGAMDDCAGLGILLSIARNLGGTGTVPDLLFFFSEMEESKGLKEHPHLLKNKGEGYTHGMGARQIAAACLQKNILPDEVITVDTTPLFKAKPGIALYSKHWKLNSLEPGEELMNKTGQTVKRFKNINPDIHLDNNTNDYLHYGYEFNAHGTDAVVSVALEPAIFPYHQKGEKVFKEDIKRVLNILTAYLKSVG